MCALLSRLYFREWNAPEQPLPPPLDLFLEVCLWFSDMSQQPVWSLPLAIQSFHSSASQLSALTGTRLCSCISVDISGNDACNPQTTDTATDSRLILMFRLSWCFGLSLEFTPYCICLCFQNEADRTLIYVTLYISECLKKLQKVTASD